LKPILGGFSQKRLFKSCFELFDLAELFIKEEVCLKYRKVMFKNFIKNDEFLIGGSNAVSV
jgi:hypothetical protein